MNARCEAAASLAEVLVARGYADPIVVALPRGGVPIGAAIARALACPIDLWLAREIPVPFHRERILGGIAEGGTAILDDAERASLDDLMVREAVNRERALLAHDVHRFRAGVPGPSVRGCTAILVDEAIDSPWRMLAAARDLAKRGARAVVVATPILTPAAALALRHDAADIACITMALDLEPLRAWRGALPLVTDAEIHLTTEYASITIAC
jgi:predicted phosphoribosyltransferase